jgi:hypothetical protein
MNIKRITKRQRNELAEWARSVVKSNAHQTVAIQALRLQALYITHRQAEAHHRHQAEALRRAWNEYVNFRSPFPTPAITKDTAP